MREDGERRMKGERGALGEKCNRNRYVGRRWTVQCLVGDKKDFQDITKFNKEPVKIMQYWRFMSKQICCNAVEGELCNIGPFEEGGKWGLVNGQIKSQQLK